MDVNEIVVEMIKERMADQELSAMALSKQIGMPQTSLNRYVTGVTELSFRRMYDICTALDITMAEVAGRINHHQSKPKKKSTKPVVKKRSIRA